jgi:cyclophilin family peptidyl-prolyl cis-trans isomerase
MLLLVVPLFFGATADSQMKKPRGQDRPLVHASSRAIIETSVGAFEVELYASDAPKTVENFVKLAEKKFFDGIRVHRISRSQGVIQMGDDKSRDTNKTREWGSGGRSFLGKEFEDELDPKTPSYKEGYKRGTVAMANRGPHTNTSQFLVMLRDLPYMPRNYTIFGKVVEGQDVIDRIGQVEIVPVLGPQDGRPKEHIIVKKVTIKTESISKPVEKK